MGTNAETVAKGWGYVAEGNWDALVADYHEDMKFIFPGQNDVLDGIGNFRAALEGIGAALPPGFDVLGVEQFESDASHVLSLVKWKSNKVEASQLTVLFHFRGDKIDEERWFIDTEQWKAAF